MRVSRFTNLFLVGLLAGLLVGVLMVEIALLEVPASVYTAVEKPKHEVFEPIAIVYVLVVVSGIFILSMSRREFKTTTFVLTLVGMLCVIASVITTLLVNVPINAEIMDAWSVENPPANWAEVRDRWNLFHAIRTVSMVVAFFCLSLAATLTRNVNPNRGG
ncbi:MAG: anthrone oxygenase family protein [Rubrobacteraceae bacterium]